MKVVALLTDFGLKDHYVGVVKGKILQGLLPTEYPYFVDLTHDIPPQDVKKGALVLAFSQAYFPPGTIFLGVVDPGVGSKRSALILQTARYCFVGPDNGLFTLILRKASQIRCYQIDEAKVLDPPYSQTFHARDLFAPALVKLLKGRPPSFLGQEISPDGLVQIPLPEPQPIKDGFLVPILDVDRFGNLITSFPKEACQGKFKVLVNGVEVPLVPTYSYGQRGEVIALFGSQDYLEIAVRDGSAYDKLGLPEIKVLST